MQTKNSLRSGFDVVKIPPERALVVDAGILGSKRHVSYGLVEGDVTKAQEIRSRLERETGSKLSLTAFLAACLAKAVEFEPRVQGYKIGRTKMVLFRDVHVSTMIEVAKGGVAIPHVIRDANKRSIRDISNEIRSVKADPNKSEQYSGTFARIATKIPRWLRMRFFRWMMSDPNSIQKNCGTIMLTSVGMFGKGGGWGLTHLPLHTTGVTVGGIHSKPTMSDDGSIFRRDFVCLTLAFDHDIVDGAPAARFTSRFIELIESASLLEQEEADHTAESMHEVKGPPE